jgi:hypothetical protein
MAQQTEIPGIRTASTVCRDRESACFINAIGKTSRVANFSKQTESHSKTSGYEKSSHSGKRGKIFEFRWKLLQN